MKISFLDFWGGFDSNNNFFIHLLKEIKNNIEISDPENSDIIIYSVFGQEHKKYNNSKKIFYTGENIRPNFNDCDYSFTFDFNGYDNKNIRLPLWYLYIDWFNVKTYNNPNWLIPITYLNGNNEFNIKSKNKFCCSVFSSPYQSRFSMINKIREYKPVDCFGKIHNYSLPDGEKIKMDTISEYKFSICFENTNYPGYFTEKLLHAKIAGTIPIYYSDYAYINDFNSKCCLNLIHYENESHLLEKIKIIDSDKNIYNNLLSEPLFNVDGYSLLNNLKEKINNIL
jgi:hypothetical protein